MNRQYKKVLHVINHLTYRFRNNIQDDAFYKHELVEYYEDFEFDEGTGRDNMYISYYRSNAYA